jgi:hypothetical protein
VKWRWYFAAWTVVAVLCSVLLVVPEVDNVVALVAGAFVVATAGSQCAYIFRGICIGRCNVDRPGIFPPQLSTFVTGTQGFDHVPFKGLLRVDDVLFFVLLSWVDVAIVAVMIRIA